MEPLGASQSLFSLSQCNESAPDAGQVCATIKCQETCTKSQVDAGPSCASSCETTDGG